MPSGSDVICDESRLSLIDDRVSIVIVVGCEVQLIVRDELLLIRIYPGSLHVVVELRTLEDYEACQPSTTHGPAAVSRWGPVT